MNSWCMAFHEQIHAHNTMSIGSLDWPARLALSSYLSSSQVQPHLQCDLSCGYLFSFSYVISTNFSVSFQFLKIFQFPFQFPFCHFSPLQLQLSSVLVAFFSNSVNMKFEDQSTISYHLMNTKAYQRQQTLREKKD